MLLQGEADAGAEAVAEAGSEAGTEAGAEAEADAGVGAEAETLSWEPFPFAGKIFYQKNFCRKRLSLDKNCWINCC